MTQKRDFFEHRRNELLSAETRIDRHDERHVDICHKFFEHDERRRRIERDARPAAERFDLLYEAMGMTHRLDMKGDDVRTSLGEGSDLRFRTLDHQMHIKNRRRAFAKRLHDGSTQRDVRHKSAVHDIDMDVLRPGSFNALHLIGKMREIRRENRRRHLNHRYTFFLCTLCCSISK